jgi:hypothetical protein
MVRLGAEPAARTSAPWATGERGQCKQSAPSFSPGDFALGRCAENEPGDGTRSQKLKRARLAP